MDVDVVAEALKKWGRQALSMPRGPFEVECQAYPLITSRGDRLGRIVPGHGLALDADLKVLGITKPVPGVIERTPWMRCLDVLSGNHGALTSVSDLRTIATNRQTYCTTDTFTPLGSADVLSYCNFDKQGSVDHFSTSPTQCPTRLTYAANYNYNCRDPAPGKTKYLIGMSALSVGSNARGFGMGIYSDMLSMFGGVPMDSIATTNINTVALTRYTSAVGVLMVLVLGPDGPSVANYSSAPTFTVVYTNQSGVGSRSSVVTSTNTSIINSSSILRNTLDPAAFESLMFFPFVAGDYGAQSIQSFTADVASTSVGARMGGGLFKPLVCFHAINETNVTVERDIRSEPEMLVALETDSNGILGSHQMLWICSGVVNGVATITFSFDVVDA